MWYGHSAMVLGMVYSTGVVYGYWDSVRLDAITAPVDLVGHT